MIKKKLYSVKIGLISSFLIFYIVDDLMTNFNSKHRKYDTSSIETRHQLRKW